MILILTKLQLKAAFAFKSGQPSPFEHMIDESFNAQELKKLRLPNSNLNSGFTFLKVIQKNPQCVILWTEALILLPVA